MSEKPSPKPSTKRTPSSPKPRGRPSRFTQALAETILAQVARGQSLRSICSNDADHDDRSPADNDDGHIIMPHRDTVRKWLRDHPGFAAQYARAHEEYADAMFEEMLEIADDSRNDFIEKLTNRGDFIRLNPEAISRAKLRVDTRKWMLARLAPKKYGDKLAVNHAGDVKVTVTIGGDV